MSVVKIDIIGAPTAFGQPKLGVSLGPDAVRFRGLKKHLSELGHDVADVGNVYGSYRPEYGTHDIKNDEGLINFEQVKDFSEQRSEEHTSELQSRFDLVCRLLLEKKKERIRSEKQ